MTDLTIIIPAFNEERFIARQLTELRRCTAGMRAQIIVVDNNSTDGTVSIARDSGADQVISAAGTVATLRNKGAQLARNEAIVFMDADVFPTDRWAARLPAVVAQVVADPLLLTGSWVSVPEHPVWIEKHWFKPLENGDNSHINSGHLLTSRALFARLNGFDERLRTGEDFDLSMRARAAGARIVDDTELKVVHEGYPKSLAEFVRREMWHGTGDCRTLRTFFSSKVAMAGFAVLHAQLLGAVAGILTGQPAYFVSSVCFAALVSVAAAMMRYRRASARSRLVNTLLYYMYFMARGLSPYAAALRRGGKKAAGTSRH